MNFPSDFTEKEEENSQGKIPSSSSISSNP